MTRPAHYNVAPPRADLTPREIAVLMLVAEGWNNKSVAGRLGCAVKTVETHITHITRKMLGDDRDDGKVSRVELARRVWKAMH